MAFGRALTESCHSCRCDAVVESAGEPEARESEVVAIVVHVAEKSAARGGGWSAVVKHSEREVVFLRRMEVERRDGDW